MILVDTWAWVALAVKRDQYHAVAKAQHQKLRRANRKYVTTDYILSEVISACTGRAPFPLHRATSGRFWPK